SASEFWGVNDATINALGWKADKPSDFAIKSNSKNISESLGWYTDVPISVKDKDGKIVTSTGNFARINNGESEPMLCLGMTWIRKVQGILDPNKNQFRMKLHGRSFIIPTFSKTPEVSRSKDAIASKDLVQVSTISSSSTKWLDMALKAGKVLVERCSQLTETKMGA
ncbi:20026_t:CDS:2, partial [Gigaspora rosea]